MKVKLCERGNIQGTAELFKALEAKQLAWDGMIRGIYSLYAYLLSSLELCFWS